MPKRRKPFIRGILTTNKGISATSLFPDPQGFGEWRLRQECRWNRDASPTGAQEVNELEGLSERQKLSAFRAVWGKGWVTADQYAAKYRLSDWQATSDITALIAADVITRREDGQLIEGPVVHELRRRLSIRN